MLRVLQTEPCVLYWRTMMLMEYEFTAHLTPYGSLGVLHLLPAQPLHAHVVGVRGVGSWLGQRRRLTGRRQGWRWGRLCLGDQEMLFLDILIRKFVHSAHTDAHEDRELFIQTPVFDSSQTSRGIRGTHKLLILSISRSRLNERPIRLGLERCYHTQFLSRRWRLIEIYLIFLPCLSWSLVLFSWNVQQKQTAGELPKAAGGFFAPSVSWFSHLRSHIVMCQI